MTGVLSVYRTSIGKKVVMAVTGFILTVFVFFHMLGNLKVYAGAEKLNHYAEWLKLEMGAPILLPMQGLWIARVVLLLALILHIVAASQLTLMAWSGRPVGYKQSKVSPTMYLANMMRLGGVVVLFFIIYHILHFTTGTVLPGFEPSDVYQNLIRGFQFIPASAAYIIALVALGVHIFHGGWSLFQTLGLNNRRYKMMWRTLAALVAAAIMVGNISIPLAVLAGYIK